MGRVWTSTYTRKFFLSTDKLLRTISGSSARGRRYGSGRVGSAEDSCLECPTRPSRPVFAGGGRGGSSIFNNLRFRVFQPLDQQQVSVISNPSRTAGFREIIDGFVVGFLALEMNDENRNYIYWNHSVDFFQGYQP